jgi:arginyl-tRNA synthetase
MSLRRLVAEALAAHTSLAPDEVDALLEVPPKPEMGDFAFPCFQLAKTLKKAPPVIAQELAGKLGVPFSGTALGPYVNVRVALPKLFEHALAGATIETVAIPETICVESPSPNTNKPLHLGHVRNMLLGNAITELLKRRGHTVKRLDLVNDRGVHICKSMLAYERAGRGDTPESTGKKGDHFVGDYYVEYSKLEKENPAIEQEAQAMLQAWEAGDENVRALWSMMRQWCLSGMRQTYADYGVAHDSVDYESEIYTLGKEIVEQGKVSGVFKADEKGAFYADTPVGQKYVLRADGTSIYVTQDIALAKLRFECFRMNRLVYVVGSEQMHHFKALFSIFEELGFSFGKSCFHLSYGMVYLPEGKMKSREGTVVDADDLRSEMIALAREEVARRSPELSNDEVSRRATAIGMGALKFFILKFTPTQDMTYDSKESISFTGETGPYVQYTYARLSSIIRKAGGVPVSVEYAALTEDLERQVALKLLAWPATLASAADGYRPSVVCTYVIELAQLANTYYHDVQVLTAEVAVKDARLKLLDSARTTLKDALGTLGIDVLEEM